MNEKLGIMAMKGNMAFYVLGQKDLTQCMHDHMIACYNWVPGKWNDKFGENVYARTLNSFKYILCEVQEEEYIPIDIADNNNVESNVDGLDHLMENVSSFNNGDISLIEMIDKHAQICATELNDYKEYFRDGGSNDLYLSILRYVIKAVEGDDKAKSRLKVDLGIEDVCLTIKQIL